MKQKKLMTMLICGILTLGLTRNMADATSIDELYKYAYESMIVAQKEKTQISINKARVAIDALPASMMSARGTFSSEVDKVQQPIFVKIVDLIMDARKAPTQEKINAGKALLDGVQPFYANSWSSALDEVQNVIIKNTINAIDNAIAYNTDANRLAANAMLAELYKSTNKDLINYTNMLSEMYKQQKPIVSNTTTESHNGSDGSTVVINNGATSTVVVDNGDNTTTTIVTTTENSVTTKKTTITNNVDGSVIFSNVLVTENN